MADPGVAHPLVQHPSLGRRLGTDDIVFGGVERLSPVGSRDQVDHGLIALVAESDHSPILLVQQGRPGLGGQVGRDVQGAPVTEQNRGPARGAGNGVEGVFQGQHQTQHFRLDAHDLAGGRIAKLTPPPSSSVAVSGTR